MKKNTDEDRNKFLSIQQWNQLIEEILHFYQWNDSRRIWMMIRSGIEVNYAFAVTGLGDIPG